MADQEQEHDSTAEADPQRFKKLPDHVRLEDTVATQDTRMARDPEDGRDTDRDFMFRHLS